MHSIDSQISPIFSNVFQLIHHLKKKKNYLFLIKKKIEGEGNQISPVANIHLKEKRESVLYK
jgi:hypothetical protein